MSSEGLPEEDRWGEKEAAGTTAAGHAFHLRMVFRRHVMRAPIVVVIASLLLTACGTTHKTVVVQPPPGSTTVVDQNGNAHVIERDR
jgi:hypothetical protein